MSELLASPSDCGCNACIPIVLNAGTVNNVTNNNTYVTGGLSMMRVTADFPAVGLFDGQQYYIEGNNVTGHLNGEEGHWSASLGQWVIDINGVP